MLGMKSIVLLIVVMCVGYLSRELMQLESYAPYQQQQHLPTTILTTTTTTSFYPPTYPITHSPLPKSSGSTDDEPRLKSIHLLSHPSSPVERGTTFKAVIEVGDEKVSLTRDDFLRKKSGRGEYSLSSSSRN